jgi:8-oxo-dGTP pyrophosphatase MutT (NUDIX family)
MPHRIALINLLENYKACDALEHKTQLKFLAFVRANEDCFLRSNLSGHVTASCWLLSPDHSQVLLTHHKKIGRWLQLGGHSDGDPEVLRVALKEAEEESGISHIKALSPDIFDLDIHLIAEHKGTPAHYHYDIRFALEASSLDFCVSDESHALAWQYTNNLLSGSITNDSLARMAQKWHAQKKLKKYIST